MIAEPGYEPEAPIVICPQTQCSPSNNEREHHRLTHWPFRSWHAECVMGKSRESPHKYMRGKRREELGIPTNSFDYMFLDGKTRIIVLRGRRSRMIFAHVVTHKGSCGPWIVGRIVEDLDLLGCGRMIIKSDQEPAIEDLQKQVRQQRWVELVVMMQMVRENRTTDAQVELINENSSRELPGRSITIQRARREIYPRIKVSSQNGEGSR
jgi:hypothetical protein